MKTNKVFIFLVCIIILQIILPVFKLLNIIAWGWEWILAPVWMPYLAIIIAGVLIVSYILLYNIIERIFYKHE